MKPTINNIYEPEFVEELFNKMSNSYERMNYITSFGFSIRWRKQFLMQFPSSDKNVQVLDLLSGMGETWGSIHKKFPNAKISALDFSDGMIQFAKNRNENHYKGKVTILKQDALKNQLESNCYDYVFCSFGLKTFNDAQVKTLAYEVKRILKPNGQFSFIDVSEPNLFILKFFYRFYLKNLIPILGKLFLGSPETYQMLWKYTNQFQNAKKAKEIFVESGLITNYQEYFFGAQQVLLEQKIKKMIHDKDYIIRIVKQFSEMLTKIILGNNEGELAEQNRIFETNMNDTFKMSFEELSSKSAEEIIQLIDSKDSAHHVPYFELLGHLFYLKGKENQNQKNLEKSLTFYELYLQKSGIFALPIISRINEIKNSL